MTLAFSPLQFGFVGMLLLLLERDILNRPPTIADGHGARWALPISPMVPNGLVPPPVALPWNLVLLPERPTRELFPKAKQPAPYRTCELLPEPDVYPDARSARSGDARHAFPAYYSAAPKLWQTDRCAGEGLR
jgi:hypothetical protein